MLRSTLGDPDDQQVNIACYLLLSFFFLKGFFLCGGGGSLRAGVSAVYELYV